MRRGPISVSLMQNALAPLVRPTSRFDPTLKFPSCTSRTSFRSSMLHASCSHPLRHSASTFRALSPPLPRSSVRANVPRACSRFRAAGRNARTRRPRPDLPFRTHASTCPALRNTGHSPPPLETSVLFADPPRPAQQIHHFRQRLAGLGGGPPTPWIHEAHNSASTPS